MKEYPIKYKGNKITSSQYHPLKRFFISLKYGLFIYHYPICCVLQYLVEELTCEPSSYKRNEEYDLYYYERGSRQHVPCNHCMKRIQRIQKKLPVKYYNQ